MAVSDLAQIFKAYDVRGIYGRDIDGDKADNTEPLLRLNRESLISRQDMERRRDEVLELIRS